MREIKFRALAVVNDKHNSIKVGDFVYGQYIESGCDAPCIIFGDGEQIEVDKNTLGQLIGLTDNGGVKIYEGDVLEVCDYYMEPTINEVKWGGDDYPAFTLSPEIGSECNCFSHLSANGDILIKVIGNIHQYPELLKA